MVAEKDSKRGYPVKVELGGKKYDLTVRLKILDDLDSESRDASSTVVYWRKRKADVVRDLALAEAEYKNWKAVRTLELIDSGVKLTDARISAGVRAAPEYGRYKEAIAKLQWEVEVLDSVSEAFGRRDATIRALLYSRGRGPHNGD